MPTSLPSSRWNRLAVALLLIFAALNTINAINKGGDADVFFEGGRRLLDGAPPYAGSSAASGFIGPPFQALFFTPFAAIAMGSPTAAKVLWHLVGIASLIAGILFTANAWSAVRSEMGLRPRTVLPTMFVPVAAVLLPLQTNFEHQNMNPLLLALMTGSIWLLETRATAAGVLLGVAIALKVFPALLLLVLVLRARWRVASIATLVAVVLTLVPLAIYGFDAYLQLMRDFVRLANSGFPVRGNNQSLVAALDRLVNEPATDGVREVAAVRAFPFVATLLLGALAWASIRRQARTRTTATLQLFAALVLAVLLSPIAWDHYWLLLLPAFVVLFDSRDRRLLGPTGLILFVVCAALTTGISPLLLGRSLFNLTRAWSPYTIAGAIAFAALLWLCWIVREDGYRAKTTIHGAIAPTP